MATTTRAPRRRISKEESAPIVESSKRNISWGTIILALLLLLAVGAAGYFYYQTKHPQALNQEKEKEDLIATIGQFIDLPTDETPTLATVTDREKLADQAFFQKAENGDKVLIYSNSGKAILYRPSTGKVIDITTTQVAEQQAEVESTPEPAPEASPEEDTATVTLYNGSTKAGVTDATETTLQEKLSQYAVASKEKAKKTDYEGMLVIDVAGSREEQAKKIAEALGGQIVTLPEGETAPSTDILVIVGNE